MKKPLALRIIGLAAIYCIVFIFLATLQFSNRGNFSLTIGSMNIRGSYLQEDSQVESVQEINVTQITGGIRLFYSGIEFNLKDDRGNSLMLNQTPVNPEFMI